MGKNEGMATHVALLRGINLGGRNKVAMADLRALVSELGHADAATYIQSGNVLFTAPEETDCAQAARDMTEAIAAPIPREPPVTRTARLTRRLYPLPRADERGVDGGGLTTRG